MGQDCEIVCVHLFPDSDVLLIVFPYHFLMQYNLFSRNSFIKEPKNQSASHFLCGSSFYRSCNLCSCFILHLIGILFHILMKIPFLVITSKCHINADYIHYIFN
jgi:hypothetical protein